MAVNVGILGFAHGHVHSYINKWKQNPDLGVTAVAGWDHDAARLEQMTKNFGLVGYPSVDELLERSDISGVVIGSETAMHAELVERAAAKGKAIVVQKPMALNMAEADRIVRAVKEYGVPFTMAWQMRVDPQNVKMKEMIETQALGKLFSVRRRHGLATHIWPNFADTWHVNPKMNRDIWADVFTSHRLRTLAFRCS
jgi:predicted dehydrogenase